MGLLTGNRKSSVSSVVMLRFMWTRLIVLSNREKRNWWGPPNYFSVKSEGERDRPVSCTLLLRLPSVVGRNKIFLSIQKRRWPNFTPLSLSLSLYICCLINFIFFSQLGNPANVLISFQVLLFYFNLGDWSFQRRIWENYVCLDFELYIIKIRKL